MAVAALGMLVVAHRNGLTQSTAESLNQTAGLGELEAKIGGPGIGTSHGLAQWLDETSERYQLDELSETAPIPEATAPAPQAAEPEAKNEDAKSADEADSEAPADDAKEKTAAPAKTTPPTASNFASSLSGKPAAAPPARTSKPKAYRPAAPPKRKLGPGDPHDPMNGEL